MGRNAGQSPPPAPPPPPQIPPPVWYHPFSVLEVHYNPGSLHRQCSSPSVKQHNHWMTMCSFLSFHSHPALPPFSLPLSILSEWRLRWGAGGPDFLDPQVEKIYKWWTTLHSAIYQLLELNAWKFTMSLRIVRRVKNKRCNIPNEKKQHNLWEKELQEFVSCLQNRKPLVGIASGIVYLHLLTAAGMWREKAEEEMSEMMAIFSPFRHRHPDGRARYGHSVRLQQWALWDAAFTLY